MAYDKVKEWMRDQLKRIDAINAANKEKWKNPHLRPKYPQEIDSAELPNDMTFSPEWANDAEPAPFKSIEQEDNDSLAKYKATFMCMFCKGNLTDRDPKGMDKHIYEFTVGKNRDGIMPETMNKSFCHEWCFLRNIGKPMYHRSFNPVTNPLDWNCNACGKEIDYIRMGAELATIRRCTILDYTQGKFQVEGHLHFCISCWLEMAGEKFFP